MKFFDNKKKETKKRSTQSNANHIILQYIEQFYLETTKHGNTGSAVLLFCIENIW